MPFEIVRQDITKMQVDAIVNTTNTAMDHTGGGVSTAIFAAAGDGMHKACEALAPCGLSEVKVTDGFSLPCRWVFHTVAPGWRGGNQGEAKLLEDCYLHALEKAVELDCASIAFPLISGGAHGFSQTEALRIATKTIGDYLLSCPPTVDLTVYLAVFTHRTMEVGSKLYAGIRQYIDDNYVDEHYDIRREFARRRDRYRYSLPISTDARSEAVLCEDAMPCSAAPLAAPAPVEKPASLKDALQMKDESFTQMLLRLLIEKNIGNADCYKRANIDRKLFSKIMCQPNYKPSKTTALALAVALELDLPQTKELLLKAGYALSHSSELDIIVEYFILEHNHNIFDINEALYEFDQPLLGGKG